MFRFEHPTAIAGLLIIAILVVLYLYIQKKEQQRTSKLGETNTISRLFTFRNTISLQTTTLLLSLGILALTISMMNPQWGFHTKKVESNATDIYLAIDLSNSMNAADISPSRLEKAKRIAESIVQQRHGDRIGLILFAESAFLQMPLTNDYATAEMFIRSAKTDLITSQGTSISNAIEVAIRSHRSEDATQKALIIISDGEDHEEGIDDAVKNAVKEGWLISTIAVGTQEGGFIPVNDGGRETYIMDIQGNPVKTALNVDALKHISEIGNGKFFSSDQFTIAQDMSNFLDKMDKRMTEIKAYTEYNSFYGYFLVIGILLLIAVFYSSYNFKPQA
ncbi:MAG: VWA domain-containing protein [Lewinellaceae bacterium]|nr:VWA domain-containing protein [Lewinellaceae bacterium]